jgi:hypothetical protein
MFQRSSQLPATPSCEIVCPQGPPGFNGSDVSSLSKIKNLCKGLMPFIKIQQPISFAEKVIYIFVAKIQIMLVTREMYSNIYDQI